MGKEVIKSAALRQAKQRSTWVGHVIADRYRVDTLLGQGGGGAVYTGVHLNLGQKVAIKVMKPQAAMDEWWRGRFTNEARIYARINSPYVVKVHDFGEESDGSMFLVMEYLPGIDMSKMLHKQPFLTTSMLCRMASHILQGLIAAHEHGIIHRDLKPANVMVLDADGEKPFVKILDFGIGKVDGEALLPEMAIHEVGEVAMDLTAMGPILGTPAYMAPEQITGGEVDGRTDLYSLGCMLYQMASGTLPFLSDETMQLLQMHLHEEPRPLSTVNPNAPVPPDLEALVMKCLHKFPDQRYASAREALTELEAITDTLFGPQFVKLNSLDQLQAGPSTAPLPVSTRAIGQADGQLETESVEKDDGNVTVEQLKAITELLAQLGKAYKSFQLYPRDNPIYAEAINESWKALEVMFESSKRIELTIDRFGILYKKQKVYEDTSLRDSYPFKLFTDGVRRLFLFEGITRKEVTEFFDCLHDVSTRRSRNSDLVTLLWERELPHVKFHLVEDLIVQTSPEVGDLSRGKARRRTGFRGTGGVVEDQGAMRPEAAPRAIDALLQPLTAAETKHVDTLKTAEDESDHVTDFVKSLMAVLGASKNKADAVAMLRVLSDVAHALLMAGDVEHALLILTPVRKLGKKDNGEEIRAAILDMGRRLAEPDCVKHVVGTLASKKAPDEKKLQAVDDFLALLPPESGAHAVIAAATLEEEVQAMLAPRLIELCKPDPTVLRDAIGKDQRTITTLCLRVLSGLGDARTLALVEPLLRHSTPEVRAEAIRALGAIQPRNLAELIGDKLQDTHGLVRKATIDAFAKAPESVAKGPMLASLAARKFAARPKSEQIRLLRCLAAMKSPEVIEVLETQLDCKRALLEQPLVRILLAAGALAGCLWLLKLGGLVIFAGIAMCLYHMGIDLTPMPPSRADDLYGPLTQCLKRIGTPRARKALARVEADRRSQQAWGAIFGKRGDK